MPSSCAFMRKQAAIILVIAMKIDIPLITKIYECAL